MGTRSLPLGRLFGVRITVDYSWFVGLFLVLFFVGPNFKALLAPEDADWAYPAAVAAAVAFFGSIIIHELGHALAARVFGIKTEVISLWLMGGFARLDRDSRSAKEEFWVSISGPLGTLLVLVVAAGTGIGIWGADAFYDDMTSWFRTTSDADAPVPTVAGLILGWLAFMNLAMLVLNLVPAFPLDGGRILRSLFWAITGNRGQATRGAGLIGQMLAALLGAFGILQISRGQTFSGTWSLLLAWMIWSGAKQAMFGSVIEEKLDVVTASELMITNPESELQKPVWVPDTETVLEAQTSTFGADSAPWVCVLNSGGKFLGIVTAQQVDAAVAQGQPNITCGELVTYSDELTLKPTDSLKSLIKNNELARLGALPVVDEAGVMLGVLIATQVQQAIHDSLLAPAKA